MRIYVLLVIRDQKFFELTRIIMVSEQAVPGGEGGADQ